MNKIILAILFAGFGAQLVKLIIYWFKHKKLTWHDLVVTGGMPSSHSAFVVSLATIIYLVEGTTAAFAISLVFAMVVIRDAFGVRRSVGNEGKQIEKLLKLNKIKSKFHYAMGHTPKQVLVGSIIGFVIAFGVYFFL
ncbi:MAG: divergent PAP2 family protein [Nanoarchaeota archaeon]|nr:divergent PAP2 family protein [Nanoarchaeota archaeon]MBU1622176.1 divergent PAP2 family protein [Nanoarchaeota archaeon]MBU1973991.1 divergent PAP2 family protein [Nanoarchaeota archaeon]